MKKIIFLVNFIFLSIGTLAANFSVAPTRFEVELGKVVTNEVYVVNHTSKPLRVETYVEGDKNFGAKYNMNNDIVVFPKKIAIKAGGTQVVRFRVRPNPNMPDGELKSYINFLEVPEEIKSTDGTGNKTKKSGQNVTIVTELGIPVYGYKGEQIARGDLKNISIKNKGKSITITGDSESFGNTSLKFFYEMTPTKGETLKGKMSMSAREGKKKISVGMTVPQEFVGQKVKIVIKDQTDKIHYRGEKQL